MTGPDFTVWLAAMKAAGHNKQACAAMFGVDSNRMAEWSRRGTDRRTALACAALLAGLPPYGSVQ